MVEKDIPLPLEIQNTNHESELKKAWKQFFIKTNQKSQPVVRGSQFYDKSTENHPDEYNKIKDLKNEMITISDKFDVETHLNNSELGREDIIEKLNTIKELKTQIAGIKKQIENNPNDAILYDQVRPLETQIRTVQEGLASDDQLEKRRAKKGIKSLDEIRTAVLIELLTNGEVKAQNVGLDRELRQYVQDLDGRINEALEVEEAKQEQTILLQGRSRLQEAQRQLSLAETIAGKRPEVKTLIPLIMDYVSSTLGSPTEKSLKRKLAPVITFFSSLGSYIAIVATRPEIVSTENSLYFGSLVTLITMISALSVYDFSKLSHERTNLFDKLTTNAEKALKDYQDNKQDN